MKHRTLRGVAALTLGAALVLSGCSSEGGSGDETSPSPSATDGADAATSAPEDVAALEAVTVTGDPGAEPTVEFETPFEVSGAAAISLNDGDGDEIAKGQEVTLHQAAYSGADGSKVGSTWVDDSAQSVPLDDSVYPQLIEVLVGKKVGTRFLFAAPGQDGTAILTVGEVTAVKDAPVAPDPADVPDRAEGEAVTPAEGLPVVTLDDTGKPSIEIPEGYTAPTELVVQPLIKGTGPEVTEDQTVIAHYTGWKLDGEQFDSSWDRGEPSTFPLSGVVAGWTQGLSGQTVGSQVLLVIPPSLGYGASEGHELQNETLVFVVDILAAY
ncbi:FKBP-type peptidyl-prolyl cis-trans isomerase [Cellulosimicrobium sp. NPDC057862]|uniref:FKBP-type peptidyl-prolyl cis-trans isomerase n=1 Tax=Cellulosimicrobium sp. NPDC057862 TaxID=3346266 RepID=UPI00366A887B